MVSSRGCVGIIIMKNGGEISHIDQNGRWYGPTDSTFPRKREDLSRLIQIDGRCSCMPQAVGKRSLRYDLHISCTGGCYVLDTCVDARALVRSLVVLPVEEVVRDRFEMFSLLGEK